MQKSLILIILLIASFNTHAKLSSPQLIVNSEGLQASLQWLEVDGATGYRLSYASFPFKGVDSVASIDLHSKTDFTITLWQQAAFYVAVQAYDTNLQYSDYSNIGFILIHDQGENYRRFWQSVSKEISEHSFISESFLYAQPPDIDTCFAGVMSEAAQLRPLNTLNETRQLHQLPAVKYANSGDLEVQQAALIQRANNFLSHTPPENSLCYSQAGYDGSNSSNLHIGTSSSDPADNIIGFINDANNVSTLAGVGHRRALLNPFLQFTSYGQVLGASAIKVSDFSTSSIADPREIPDFIAFPYLRYPYVFFSDNSSDKNTPWNLTIIENKSSFWANQYQYFTDINIKVTQKATGQPMQIEDLHTDTTASGVPNNLSWTVTDWQYDTWYTVTIENIRYQSGKVGSIQYDTFIDYKNIIDINAPLESGDQQSGSFLQGTLSSTNDKDSYAINLQGKTTFSGNSQFSNIAFYIAVYNADKQLLFAKDDAFTLDLPAGSYTLLISSCYQNTCYQQPVNYSVNIS